MQVGGTRKLNIPADEGEWDGVERTCVLLEASVGCCHI
jgi:hypothetical protein